MIQNDVMQNDLKRFQITCYTLKLERFQFFWNEQKSKNRDESDETISSSKNVRVNFCNFHTVTALHIEITKKMLQFHEISQKLT